MGSGEYRVLEDLRGAIVRGEDAAAVTAAQVALRCNLTATDIVEQGVARAAEEIGDRFETGEVFLPELLVAAESMKAVLEVLRPRILESGSQGADQTMVIGTAKGDIHDIGKDLVAVMFEGAGFKVVDLGVDVSAQRFADAIEATGARFLGLSALITTTMRNMAPVISELEERRLRTNVIVMVGGAPVDQGFAESIGADLYASTAAGAVRAARMKLRSIGAEL